MLLCLIYLCLIYALASSWMLTTPHQLLTLSYTITAQYPSCTQASLCLSGTLDKHTSGKLAPGKLDTAMAAITTEFAAAAKVKAQQLGLEQQPSMKKMAAEVLEAS